MIKNTSTLRRLVFSLLPLALFLVNITTATAQKSLTEEVTELKRAVVMVTTYDERGRPLLQGSGFFIEPRQIVTNLHVIRRASRIDLETFDGSIVTVKAVIATNEKTDLALVRIAASPAGVTTLRLEATTPLEGEPILVVGNPQGSRWKMTRGHVGMLWDFKGIGQRLQITAAIFPGSSGGPVVNQRGQVIGVAALHAKSADDLNFAVPVQSLKALQAQARIN